MKNAFYSLTVLLSLILISCDSNGGTTETEIPHNNDQITLTDHEGYVYSTVQISEQIWMADF